MRDPLSKFIYFFALLTACAGIQQELKAEEAISSEQSQFFENKIRPILVKECYSCHSVQQDEQEGGLTLDTREGIRSGGEQGPAVVPGNHSQSLLLKAIRYTDSKLRMPPDGKLSGEQIADIEKWIAMGAPDPRDGDGGVRVKYEIDLEEGRKFWAFQLPAAVELPQVRIQDWPRTEIDYFLLSKMESKGLDPVADSEPNMLARRLYFDLIGLPPAPEKLAQFEKEYAKDSQAAVESLVDELLQSQGFGERWGRHWLDVARYAESSGNASNFAFPHAWRYRDWVIEAFMNDMPYDQFVRAQLAGDLLPAKNETEQAENLIATGFLALGPKSLSERNRQQFQMDVVDEQIDTTFQAFQALTVACARCHDHRFDPIPQTDYYALAGIFRSTETCYGTIRSVQSNHPSPLLVLPVQANIPAGVLPLDAAQRGVLERQIELLTEQMAELSGGPDGNPRRIALQARLSQLRGELNSFDEQGNPKLRAMGVREGLRTDDCPLYIRGEIDQPGQIVKRGFPQVLTTSQPHIDGYDSGRLELAEWIASEENPLTARVMANRVWLHLMGRGLVSTVDNFGASGQRPSHPELLDYLAISFVENDWSVKQLIRSIVLSRAYQLSSRMDPENYRQDPDNVYVWRMPKRRLEAEAMRDTLLALGQNLDVDFPEGSLVAQQGEGNVSFRIRGDFAAGDVHRSVFLPIVRDEIPEILSIFDFPDPSLIIGERSSTTIPEQSLFLMNNEFVIRQAAGMASHLISEYSTESDRVNQAYRMCYSRLPEPSEMRNATLFLYVYGQANDEAATWAAFCQALFASAEFSLR
ncbi:PSD1 and planctomycete cytochrome C domain-containing protein [Rubinisphaera italica]|uniref:Planctomycete cytochrome C n=1 Tax=Rubinisphaera italica TaxID=2527969 RepID=A0A5C5XJX1_9PLAN|nr:PSD1 and planctomycete cytochrome C domain-containing protein [Rubinisphaera italica]TWT63507.1 Planctomycete cytochrome C [Rubinisphaera italica]